MLDVTKHQKMQIKTTGDITSHLSEWLSSMNQQTTSAGEDVEKGEPFCTVSGNADWCSHCGKQYGHTSKKLKVDLLFDPLIPLLGIYWKEPKTLIWKNMSTSMFIAALFAITKIWSSPTVHQQMSGKTTMGYLHNGILWSRKEDRAPTLCDRQHGWNWRALC